MSLTTDCKYRISLSSAQNKIFSKQFQSAAVSSAVKIPQIGS